MFTEENTCRYLLIFVSGKYALCNARGHTAGAVGNGGGEKVAVQRGIVELMGSQLQSAEVLLSLLTQFLLQSFRIGQQDHNASILSLLVLTDDRF